ncbi:MAG TPA: hypothetical protein VGR37_07390 [Longimicrobiaceae bacterium]|nr:hypothetical protein [Longimicrobiaceae bacterium]
MVARHEALRVVFEEEGGEPPRQRVLPPAPVPLPVAEGGAGVTIPGFLPRPWTERV